MVNKKAIVGIIEATIAILIVISVLFMVFPKTRVTSEVKANDIINPFLENIAKNNSLREFIIENPTEAEKALDVMFGKEAEKISAKYSVRICDYTKICGLEKYPEKISGSIYSNGRIISSGNESESHMTVQIFLWFER